MSSKIAYFINSYSKVSRWFAPIETNRASQLGIEEVPRAMTVLRPETF